ncbi:hypothetical protein ACF1GW_18070 [Streptomyces achromogenes]|uniref:hypothetical protein n=1 Tax=Streptomyces achromogenes TaxID=67255 RepID=UPI0036FDB6CD
MRRSRSGCPYFDKDLTWAHDRLVPEISTTLASAAHASGAECLDLPRAFDDREVCSTTTVQAGPDQRSAGRTREWVRFMTTGAGRGQRQESLHPNYYG